VSYLLAVYGVCGLQLVDAYYLSQILLTVVTATGIIVAFRSSKKTLEEVRLERRKAQLPFLVFETGGFHVPVKFEKAGRRIPGKNPDYVELAFASMREDAESIRPTTFDGFGRLKNFGQGTCFSTEVTWLAESISIAGQEFKIDDKKRLEPRYGKDLNTYPVDGFNVEPKGESHLTWLPVFIEKDVEKVIESVEGNLIIRGRDSLGASCEFIQNFHIFTNYHDDEPNVNVVFDDPQFA
jgi:hypothetical protein